MAQLCASVGVDVAAAGLWLCFCMQSFLTLSLENVAHHVKLNGGASEAERYIRDMVRTTEYTHTTSCPVLSCFVAAVLRSRKPNNGQQVMCSHTRTHTQTHTHTHTHTETHLRMRMYSGVIKPIHHTALYIMCLHNVR